jgi:small-conductance mechanosensitive channel
MRSRSTAARDFLASWFGGRLIIVGTAALGFIATFVVIRNQIASIKDAMLPLLAFVPAYLLLIFLNMLWSASAVSRFDRPRPSSPLKRRLRVGLMSAAGLALGVLAALWYVHSVAK